MAEIEINDHATAKTIAATYGVKWPAGQGRHPVVALYNAIVAAGDTVTGSYVPNPKATLKPAAPGARDYAISRTVMVERKTSKGTRKMPSKETITVNVREIRELMSNTGVRGKVAKSTILGALAALRAAKDRTTDWSDDDIASAVIKPIPVKVPSKSAKAAVSKAKPAAKPAKSQSKGKDATAVVDAASVADSLPETATA
jgi:hypothetical protein